MRSLISTAAALAIGVMGPAGAATITITHETGPMTTDQYCLTGLEMFGCVADTGHEDFPDLPLQLFSTVKWSLSIDIDTTALTPTASGFYYADLPADLFFTLSSFDPETGDWQVIGQHGGHPYESYLIPLEFFVSLDRDYRVTDALYSLWGSPHGVGESWYFDGSYGGASAWLWDYLPRPNWFELAATSSYLGSGTWSVSGTPSPIPLPAGAILLLTGAGALGALRWRHPASS